MNHRITLYVSMRDFAKVQWVLLVSVLMVSLERRSSGNFLDIHSSLTFSVMKALMVLSKKVP